MLIKQITKNEAQDFFRRFEHLGNCGLGVWHYGAFCDDQLLSVVSLGPTGFNPQRSSFAGIVSKFDIKIIQLTRGGTRFDAEKNTASNALSQVFKEVKKKFGNTMIVAYSDTRWNEIGTIYQAANFIYLGQTNPKGQSNYIIHGKTMSGWTVRKRYNTRSMDKLLEVDMNAKRIPLTAKHLYLYINTDKKTKRLITNELQPKIKPYPKRCEYNIGSMVEVWERKRLIIHG